ncbi:GGDEF domain-containing protein [Gemmobacter straminiformis]|uniref:GGDEF domain-containing protein n=2 Tax=Paragemmobacter straminiformis TaxID=2045119 RepID=A0A842I409_9RHOB|nr:GGDEF domain-containing protein [Gemmobacter straminiformis]
MPMLLRLDAQGRITAMGPTLARVLGTAKTFAEAFPPEGPPEGRDIASILAARRLRLRAADGTVLRGLAIPDGAGGALLDLSFGLGVVEAVRRYALTDADFAATELTVELLYLVEAKTAVTDELRRLNARIEGARLRAETEAQSDALTGIGNRRALMAALDGLIAGGRRFGLIHVDLDHFKAVNDTLGHAAGDHVLAQAAQVLAAETRAGDTVARIGGDEFVLVLPSVPDAARLQSVADRLALRMAEPIAYGGAQCRVAASLGLALFDRQAGVSAESLLAAADAALYAAKRAGRGRAVLAQNDAAGPTVP